MWQALVGHLHVDVFEMDGVAEIFGGAIELLIHGHGPYAYCGHTIVQHDALIQQSCVGMRQSE